MCDGGRQSSGDGYGPRVLRSYTANDDEEVRQSQHGSPQSGLAGEEDMIVLQHG